MECVERALKKSSLRPEVCVKATQQQASPLGYFDDVWPNNVHTGVSVDEFFVDDLLDFSNSGMGEEEEVEERDEEKEEGDQNNKGCVDASVSPQNERTEISNSKPKDDFGALPLPPSELSVPAEDLADLEWLSHFVEESFSEQSLTYTASAATGNFIQKSKEESEKPSEPESPNPCFNTPVPAKARSKRSRSGGRAWCSRSPSATTDSSSTSSTTSSTSSSPSSLIYTNNVESMNVTAVAEKRPAAKKQRRKLVNEVGESGAVQAAPPAPRRCSHCGVQKTPQWRTGPLGAKTLCNACGVRFKSGRLLPEYRPACSPTFSSDLHSNSHRKVLEMRRKKETVAGPEPGLAPAVQSF